MSNTTLSPEQIRTELRKLAKQQGLDPALAESALAPEKHIPDDLMDLLAEVAAHLMEAASPKGTKDNKD